MPSLDAIGGVHHHKSNDKLHQNVCTPLFGSSTTSFKIFLKFPRHNTHTLPLIPQCDSWYNALCAQFLFEHTLIPMTETPDLLLEVECPSEGISNVIPTAIERIKNLCF